MPDVRVEGRGVVEAILPGGFVVVRCHSPGGTFRETLVSDGEGLTRGDQIEFTGHLSRSIIRYPEGPRSEGRIHVDSIRALEVSDGA